MLDSDLDKLASAVATKLSALPLPPPMRVLDAERAAAYLTVSPEALKLWRREHRGPAFKRIGNRVVYELAALDQWLDQQPDGGAV
jgi:hypothetical protein